MPIIEQITNDPEGLIARREEIALRNMEALLSLAETATDENARVKAAAELNKMLSLGILNRGTIRATQINRFNLPPGGSGQALPSAPSVDATGNLLRRFGSCEPTSAEADIAETQEALDGDLL